MQEVYPFRALPSRRRWKTRQQAELLQNWVRILLEMLSKDFKRNRGTSGTTDSYTDPFLLDRLLEIYFVASGIDSHLDITLGLQVVDNSSFVSVLVSLFFIY